MFRKHAGYSGTKDAPEPHTLPVAAVELVTILMRRRTQEELGELSRYWYESAVIEELRRRYYGCVVAFVPAALANNAGLSEEIAAVEDVVSRRLLLIPAADLIGLRRT